MLRLSIATYRLPRVIRVGKSYSVLILALQGITAGSGLATTEMKLCMLRNIKRALVPTSSSSRLPSSMMCLSLIHI